LSNTLIVKIKNITKKDELYLIEFEFYSTTLFMFTLQIPQNLRVGNRVRVYIPKTDIAIAKKFQGEFSYLNLLKATILDIKREKLLSKIVVKLKSSPIKLEALVASYSTLLLDLNIGDEVTLFIKATSILIDEVLDD